MKDSTEIDGIYKVCIIFHSKRYYCIWYSGDNDGYFSQNSKLVKSFNSSDIDIIINELGIRFKVPSTDLHFSNKDTLIIDINQIESEFLKKKIYDKNACERLLNFWNTLSDISYSIGLNFYGNKNDGQTNDIYRKLLFGCNLPALRNEKANKQYSPEFSQDERQTINTIIYSGLDILAIAFEESEEDKGTVRNR